MLKHFRALVNRVSSILTGRNDIGSRGYWLSRPNTSGSRVNESSALTYTAYWRAVCFLSSTIAHLPVDIMRRDAGRRTKLDTDPVDYLLNVQCDDELPSFAARESAQAHVLTWGGGYYEIERTRVNAPIALHLVTPDRVCPDRMADGRLVYQVSNLRQPNTDLDPVDMFHVRGLAFNGIVGYSPVALFRNAIGMGISAEQYGSSFFGNGALPGGVLQTDKNFDERPEVLERLRASWSEMHQGPANAHRIAILEDGLKFAGVGIPNTDAQFLENRKFQVTEMARIFNVPPFVVGDLERATNNNIEAQAIELVMYGILPWLKRWETEIDIKLLDRRSTGRYAKFNLGALLRGDSAARGNFYKTMFSMGVFSPNDILDLEDRNPVENGDVRLVPMNMVRLEEAGTATQADRAGSVPGGDGVTPNQVLAIGELVKTNTIDAVSHALGRLARKASRATDRHASRLDAAEFKAWAAEFWRDHSREIRDELAVLVSCLVRAAASASASSYAAASAAAETAFGDWLEDYQEAKISESIAAHASGAGVTLMTTEWQYETERSAESLVSKVWTSIGV